jgi:hypothetical protein
MFPPVAAAAVAVFKLMADYPIQGQTIKPFGEIAGHAALGLDKLPCI